MSNVICKLLCCLMAMLSVSGNVEAANPVQHNNSSVMVFVWRNTPTGHREVLLKRDSDGIECIPCVEQGNAPDRSTAGANIVDKVTASRYTYSPQTLAQGDKFEKDFFSSRGDRKNHTYRMYVPKSEPVENANTPKRKGFKWVPVSYLYDTRNSHKIRDSFLDMLKNNPRVFEFFVGDPWE